MYELAKEIDDLARANYLDGLESKVQTLQETFNSLAEDFKKGNWLVNMKILIVEDDPVSQKLLEKIVRRESYDTILVKNGKSAWEKVKKELLNWRVEKFCNLCSVRLGYRPLADTSLNNNIRELAYGPPEADWDLIWASSSRWISMAALKLWMIVSAFTRLTQKIGGVHRDCNHLLRFVPANGRYPRRASDNR